MWINHIVMAKESRDSGYYPVEGGTSIDFARRVKRSDSVSEEQLKFLSHSNTEDELEEIENLHEIGLKFLNEKQFESALKKFDRILEIDPFNVDALLHKGEVLAKTGRRILALRTFEKILKFIPNHVDAQLHIAYVLGTGRKHIESVQYYDKVLELEPNNVEALLNKSRELIILGKNLEALEVIRKITPGELITDALFNKGEALFNLKRFEQALQAFEEVLGADPKDDGAWYMKAQCLSQMKRENEADKALFVATSINPELRQRIRRKT
jgi:tetratricopeptide (TPR) repeat protein